MKKILLALFLIILYALIIIVTIIDPFNNNESSKDLRPNDLIGKSSNDTIIGFYDKNEKMLYILRAIVKTNDNNSSTTDTDTGSENGSPETSNTGSENGSPETSNTGSENDSKEEYVFVYDEENYEFSDNFSDKSFNLDKPYEKVTFKFDDKGNILLPEFYNKGYIFRGLFNEKGVRVNEINDDCYALEAKFITYGDAGLIALVCIVIVFLMLALIWGIVSLFRFLPKKKVKTDDKANQSQVIETKKVFTMADIKDDDMMAAALVATIDYHNETGENVRVVSVKQIG